MNRSIKRVIISVLLVLDSVTSWYILNYIKPSRRRVPIDVNNDHLDHLSIYDRVSLYETRRSFDSKSSSSIDKAIQDTAKQFASLIDQDGDTSSTTTTTTTTTKGYESLQYNAIATQRIHLNLVKRGKIFEQINESTEFKEQYLQQGLLVYPQMQRVPGCIANVYLQVILIPEKNHDDGNNFFTVRINGAADALISKGLLATISSIVSYESKVYAQDILRVDPYTLADLVGLRPFLSSGRNDGLASITRIIQDQIQSLLELNTHHHHHHHHHAVKEETTISQELPHTHGDDDTSALQLEGIYAMDNKSTTNLKRSKPTVAMLLSGGVDSSVALHLLLQQNYYVTAFYLKIWLEDELAHLGQCPWEDDYHTCQLVCQHASLMYGVPIILESISLQKEYKERVISYTIQEARKGRTPNPDIMCNSRVKFGCFYDAIEGRGFDYVATGHYAMLVPRTQLYQSFGIDTNHPTTSVALLQAPDPIKDQTYFLSALKQSQLQRVLFPVGNLHKTQVRALASQLNLPNKDRRDSQGLCFLGKVKFDEFLEAYLGHEPGDIVDAHSGEIIGRHNGLWFHTVGQRKGIGKVLFPKATSIGPWYVVAKDPQRRIIYASNQYDEEIFTQARSEFNIEDIHWISGQSPPSFQSIESESSVITTRRFMMKIRHGSTLMNGSLIMNSDTSWGRIRLDTKDKGLAPGQYVVFYLDGECLGSGVISESHWNDFSFMA